MTIEQATICLETLKTTLQIAREAGDYSQVEDLAICILKAKLDLQRLQSIN